jgi:hypothetical protein
MPYASPGPPRCCGRIMPRDTPYPCGGPTPVGTGLGGIPTAENSRYFFGEESACCSCSSSSSTSTKVRSISNEKRTMLLSLPLSSK